MPLLTRSGIRTTDGFSAERTSRPLPMLMRPPSRRSRLSGSISEPSTLSAIAERSDPSSSNAIQHLDLRELRSLGIDLQFDRGLEVWRMSVYPGTEPIQVYNPLRSVWQMGHGQAQELALLLCNNADSNGRMMEYVLPVPQEERREVHRATLRR